MKTQLLTCFIATTVMPLLTANGANAVQNRSTTVQKPALSQPSSASSATQHESRAAYDAQMRDVESQYARQIAAARRDIENLANKIERLEEQRKSLRQLAGKIQRAGDWQAALEAAHAAAQAKAVNAIR